MGQKKNSKIILIIIILLAILTILTGVAYTYFATDLFKSNKELFFKYLTQIGNEKEGFIDMSLKQYFEKQKTTPYQDKGDISVNITAYNTGNQFNNVNKMNLTFDGQVDTVNRKVLQNISLNYSDKVKFPVTYKKIEDIMGIQTDYIGSKYVATKEDDNEILGEENQLGKIEEFASLPFSQEEIENIKNKYFNQIIKQELQESDFSKIEESKNKGYKLTLNEEKIRNIIVKLLETLKNDGQTLDKINEYLNTYRNSAKITTNDIDNIIQQLNNQTESKDQTIEITIYETNGKITQILVKTNEFECNLKKTPEENQIQYDIEFQIKDNTQTEKIGLTAKYIGLQEMNNVMENYQLTLELDSAQYQYQYNNEVKFIDNATIEDFSDENSMLLNDYDEEQVSSFMQAVQERIMQVNKDQMEELGLEEDENPLQYVIPQFGGILAGNSIYTSNIEEEEVNMFNQKFENYESTNLQGVTVKGLLSTIQINNENREEENQKITEIHFNGEEYEATDQNIVALKDEVETQTMYRVEFEREESTGIIYRAVINKK